jgi:hypothetical protein
MMIVSAEVVNRDPVLKELYLNLDFEYTRGHPQVYLDVELGGISFEGYGRGFSLGVFSHIFSKYNLDSGC